VSILTLIAVLNVCVFASGAVGTSEKGVIGRLVTTSNRPVLVNGGEAGTGAVILSGTQLSTSAASIATVQLPNVGSVTIAPSSVVGLNFDAKSLTVRVVTGDATITTVAGVVGTVLDGNGKPVSPGSAPVPAGGNNAKNWGIAGVAVGSAAFIWAIIGWRRANDARDAAAAAAAANAALAAQLAALRTCLAGQSQVTPIKLCTSF